MKVTICGKGGCGKSTVTALLANSLVKRGKEVLIIDSDESNYGLHRHLGMENPKDFTGFFGGKGNVLNDMMLSNFSHQFFYGSWRIEDIPEDYYTQRDGIKLMVSGKIHQANEGCACAMNTVMQQFVKHLKLDENQVAILDMEAGIEHFGRGIDNEADMILMICDPSYESLQLAAKIGELADSIQKPVYYILNKVQEGNRMILHEAIGREESIAAELPMVPELTQAALKGERLTDGLPEIEKIAEKIAG
ncbi:MAG: P-loop NTPase [Lachnospiraceae bacterium]|nr:P-loop NTPase [Lachnospiraceae bacterium]